MNKDDFKDLSGDKVYDFIKRNLSEGNTIIGAVIKEKKITGPLEARKLIHFLIMTKVGEQVATYNYNRVAKHI